MNTLKLTGLFSLLLATGILLVSCEQDNNNAPRYSYLNRKLTASQVIAPTTVSSNGTMTGTYDKETHTLTYSVKLVGFPGKTSATGAPTAIHLHALADSGYNAIPSAQFNNSNIAQSFSSGWTLTSDSTKNPDTYAYIFNGTLFVDGTVVKDEDLLAGKYYIDVHTTTPVNGTAIRGQLIFSTQKP